MKLDQRQEINVKLLPNGSVGPDVVLGVEGILKSRVTEIFGFESSGKITFASHATSKFQN